MVGAGIHKNESCNSLYASSNMVSWVCVGSATKATYVHMHNALKAYARSIADGLCWCLPEVQES